MSKADQYIKNKLAERESAENHRQLKPESGLIDFCSNDYLGFARSNVLKQAIDKEITAQNNILNGSTGSRLLTGNTQYAEDLESEIAAYYGYAAGLIYNSGYDANVGLFSSLPQKGDTIITDELIHASIIDGIRLSYANRFKFKHNNLNSLEQKLKLAAGNVYIAVESIYSMDGDIAPLQEIAALTARYNAHLIVDEAHAVGVFDKGLVHQLNLPEKVFAQVVTFGKALGCHGAIVLGGNLLRDYLINFSRSFIYTTAAPFHQLAAIKMAHQMLPNVNKEQQALYYNIFSFKKKFNNKSCLLLTSNSAIQSILTGNNAKTKALAAALQTNGFDARPILSPTVAVGTERLRLCLHSYNTEEQITGLIEIINNFE